MRKIVGVFFGKGEILVKHRFKGTIFTIFTFFIITNFKTDRYLNNFQGHLFGILRLRKYQTSLQFFPCENEAVKHDLIEFKVQCLKVFCYHGKNLPSCFLIQFLEQLLKFLLNFTLLK